MESGVSKGPVAPARSGECHPRTGPSLGAEAPRHPPPPGRPPGSPPPLRPAPVPSGRCHPPAAPRRRAGPAPRPRIPASPHPSSPGFGHPGPPARRGTGAGRGGETGTGGCPRRGPVEPHGQSRASHARAGWDTGVLREPRGGPPKVGFPAEGSPRPFERVPRRVSAGDRWDASRNGRDVTAKLKQAADVPLRGRVFYRGKASSTSKYQTESTAQIRREQLSNQRAREESQ